MILRPLLYSQYLLVQMQKPRDDANRYSPLFADTEFVHSKMNYLTLVDRESDKIPTVLPIEDETITLQEIENQISIIYSQHGSNILLPSESLIHKNNAVPSLKTLKYKYGRKKINGQQVEYSSKLGTIDMKKIMESLEKCPQTTGQKCKICCIMIGKKQDIIHVQFKWKSQKDALNQIIYNINKNYGSKLTEKDIAWYGVTFQKTKQDEVTFFKLRTEKYTSLQNYIFQSDSISFIGIQIIVNRFSFEKANQRMKVQRSISNFDPMHSQNILSLRISKDIVYNLEYQYYKNYQIQELFSILQLQNPQSKGLKFQDSKFSPYNYIYCLGQYFKQNPNVHKIETQLALPGQILMKQIEIYPILTEAQLRAIEGKNVVSKKSKKFNNISALRLFCSDCNFPPQKPTTKFYRIISLFLKNYHYHYLDYTKASISARFTKMLHEEIIKKEVYKGSVYRRLGYELKCEMGDQLQFNNFIVCSKNKDVAFSNKYSNSWNGKTTYITLHSETGRVVGDESNLQGLQEIIFLPYRKFIVMNIQKNIRQESIELRLKQHVQKIQIPPIAKRPNILLWIDDKIKQGTKTIDYLFKQKVQMQAQQLTSTEQFKSWIMQKARFLQQQDCNIVIITNMARNQKTKFNQYAGTDIIKLAKKELPYSTVILYIGDLQKANMKLKEKSIDPASIFVTNEYQKMLRYLIEKLIQKPVQKRQSKGIENIQKQNWQDYFSIIETNKFIEQEKAPQLVVPNMLKSNKYTSSVLLNTQKQQIHSLPNKQPKTSKPYFVESNPKKQEKPSIKKVLSLGKQQEKPQLKQVGSPGKQYKSSIYGVSSPKQGTANVKTHKIYQLQ